MVDANVSINSVASYADSCFLRAQKHVESQNWNQAIAELKEAIRENAKRSEYHALLGVVYFNQQLNGMARVYINQALKLNANNELARCYWSKLASSNDSNVSQKGEKHQLSSVKSEKGRFFNKALLFSNGNFSNSI